MNYRQIFARKEEEKKKLLVLNSQLDNQSGIYIFTRFENGFKFAYVGQALHLLDRLVSHLQGYEQHIDRSLKKHKLWSKDNPNGWQLKFIHCHQENLNTIEQQMILDYATSGYQMLNKTSGSQGTEKFAIVDNQRKGYLQGKNDGKIATIKQIKVYFDKYLDVIIKQPTNKIKERKLKEFIELLEGTDNGNKETRVD
ncbi:MAG: GIY-YIG nuclease family protein [Clostridia bacterium]|nr:GIY-YIG nuclease family protein [Clostridia bacterium]MBO7712076.1 GIY-YIG nuclease family protein [Methanobrevibacter sp.]